MSAPTAVGADTRSSDDGLMAYRVTPVAPSQAAEQVAAIWDATFGRFSGERCDWIYADNPAGEALLCLLHDDTGDQAVGSAALFPRRLSARGVVLAGGIAGDLMVMRDHRSLGPAVQLKRGLLVQSSQSGIRLAYGFPNAASVPIMERVGYQQVGSMAQWALPLRSDSYLRSYLPHIWFRRPLALLIDSALRLRSGVLSKAFGRRRECAVTNRFGADFDALWSRIASRYSLVGEKTPAFLDWRYRRCPAGSRREAFVVRSSGGSRLLGYVIFSARGERVDIADFAHDRDDLSLTELLSRFMLAQRKVGAEVMSVAMAASDDVSAAFERVGFRFRGEIHPLMLFVPPAADFAADALLNGSWYLAPGDNDT